GSCLSTNGTVSANPKSSFTTYGYLSHKYLIGEEYAAQIPDGRNCLRKGLRNPISVLANGKRLLLYLVRKSLPDSPRNGNPEAAFGALKTRVNGQIYIMI